MCFFKQINSLADEEKLQKCVTRAQKRNFKMSLLIERVLNKDQISFLNNSCF